MIAPMWLFDVSSGLEDVAESLGGRPEYIGDARKSRSVATASSACATGPAKPGAVLAAVKNAARRAGARWPAAILDRGCAWRLAGDQAGTKKRRYSRTKKLTDGGGATALPAVVGAPLQGRSDFHLRRRGGPHVWDGLV